MTERLIEIARRIQQRPWNQPGSDKTWVLHAMWQDRAFRAEVQRAERVRTG